MNAGHANPNSVTGILHCTQIRIYHKSKSKRTRSAHCVRIKECKGTMIKPHASMRNKNVFQWQKALRRAQFTPATFTALFMLSTYAGPHGEECRPGLDILMVDTNLSRNSVRTALAQGIDRGFLVQVSPGKWRGSAAVYNLALPRKGSVVDPFTHGDPKRKGSMVDPFSEKKGVNSRPRKGSMVDPHQHSTKAGAHASALGRSGAAPQPTLADVLKQLRMDTPKGHREDLQYSYTIWEDVEDAMGDPVDINSVQVSVSDDLVTTNPRTWTVPPERHEMFTYLVEQIKKHSHITHDSNNKGNDGKARRPHANQIELEYPFDFANTHRLELDVTVPLDKLPAFLGSLFHWFDELEVRYPPLNEIESDEGERG